MKKILNRTKQEWMDAIKESIEKKKEAIAAAQNQLKQERLVTT